MILLHLLAAVIAASDYLFFQHCFITLMAEKWKGCFLSETQAWQCLRRVLPATDADYVCSERDEFSGNGIDHFASFVEKMIASRKAIDVPRKEMLLIG